MGAPGQAGPMGPRGPMGQTGAPGNPGITGNNKMYRKIQSIYSYATKEMMTSYVW